LHRRTVANYRQIEKILQSATPKQRATMIKQNGLDGAFDADGSLTADFLRSLGENVVDGQTDTQGENAAQRVDFSLKGKRADGIEVYETDEQIKKLPYKERRQKFIDVMANEYRGRTAKFVKNGQTYYATFEDADVRKNIYGDNKSDPSGRDAKVNTGADGSIFELVENATYDHSSREVGKTTTAHKGVGSWDYFVKTVQVDGTVFDEVINVRQKSAGEYVYSIELYENKKIATKPPNIPENNQGVLTQGAQGSDPTNSIPQKSDLSTASGEKASGNFDHRFMSPDLWRREGEVRREIAKISEDSGENISVLARDLSDEGKKHHKKLKQAFATLSEVSGGKLQMVVVEKNSTFTGAYAHGDTVYISADAVESGKWGEALIEESVHFAQGTQEHSLLRAFIADDTALLAKIESELTKEGNNYGFTVEDAAAFRAYLDGDADTELTGRALRYSNELTAHMSAELLSNEAVIDRLVGQHATLAEKILIKFKQLGRAFAKDKALAKRVADAEQIYLAAIERRGWKYENGKIVQSGEDEEESTIDYSRMNDKSFAQNVNEILNMSDEDAKRNAEEGNFVQVMPNTPALVREYVKNAEDLPIIIRFDALYLASRHDGALQGHYHNLGADIMPKLPDIIAHPDAIVKMKNGRVNLYSQFTTAKGKNGIISVELNTVKDINSKYSKYNLVVTVLPVKDTYAQNNLMNNAVAVAYEKEDLSQVNPQLHKWLAIVNDKSSVEEASQVNPRLHEWPTTINDKSSTTIITENSDLSTPKRDFRAKEQTSDDFSDAMPKKKSKTKAEVLEDNARLREEKRKANERADERDDRLTLGERIGQKVSTLKGLRDGRMMAASEYKSDVLRGSVERLAQITYSRTVTGSVRHIVKDLSEWYVQGNPLLVDENAYDEDIAIMMQEIALGEEGEELSFGEMRMLDNILGHMLKIDEKFNKVKKGNEYTDAKPYAEKYVRNMRDAKKNETGFVRLMRSRYLRTFGDPLSLVRAFDAYAAEGFWTETYQEFRQAIVDMSIAEMDMMRNFEEFFKQNKGFEKHLLQSTVTYRGQELRFDEAASLYMTTKRKQAQRGLVESYYTVLDDNGNKHDAEGFAPRATGEGGKLSDIQIATICKQQREELWALFDEQERAYISMLEQTYEDMREIKREADFDIKGFSTVSERGYYFPIRRDQVAKEIKSKLFEVDRVSHLSINKAVVEGANAGLIIEPASDVLRRYAHSLALYANFSIPMENYNRLLNLDVGGNVKNPTTVKRLAEQYKDTQEMLKYFDKLAKDIQGSSEGTRNEQSLWSEGVERLRGSYAKFQLGANPKVLVTQFSSLFAASSRLDYSCLLSGLGTASGGVDKYCRLAELRNSENTAALASGVLTEMTNKIGDKLMMGIGKIDRLVVTRLFGACQQQIAKDKGLKVGSEENKIEAGKLLTEVILDTQQNSLATERSDAMRSSDTLLRSLTMFSADAMKVFGRFADGWGRSLTLSKQLKNTTDAKARVAIEAELKEARREFRRAAGALVASSVFMALIAQLFRDLYAKDDDKELDERVADITIDALGNMVGGLPILRDVASYLTDGYEMDNFMLSTFNDVLVASTDVLGLAGDAIGGKDISSQDVAKTTRKAVYAVGQVFGIPIRNGYNLVTGLSSRFSKKAKYWNENLFYKQSYTNDLQTAMDAGDERMIALIASMMMDERVGDVDKTLSDGLRPLVEGGYDVLPRALGDSIAYDGEEIVLTKRQRKRFLEVRGIAEEQILSMMSLQQYKEATDEVRARAIKLIWEVYYDLAIDDVLGVDSAEKNVLFAEAIDMDKLALIIATARGIKADVGANGKAINGSRLAKIEAYVESLKLKAAQKYMVMGYLGYRNKNGEDKVRAYINTLSALSKEEKRLLLEYSGYAA
jgi:hypothetical protein